MSEPLFSPPCITAMSESVPLLPLPPPHPSGADGATGVGRLAAAMVADDLAAVEHRLVELLRSTIAIIPEIGGHLTFAGGKRFRPLVTLLAARAAGFDAPERITVAAVGELLHTATLLHDDVIDNGEFRRGRPAARLRYGNGLSVLTGDFCFARALQAMADAGQIDAIRTMSAAVTRMAEGEVAQLHVAGDTELDLRRYYLIIDRKTAALVAWCTAVAGLIDPTHSAALHEYGLELGYAFQIADDVIDYVSALDHMGKVPGQDLRDGKMTLPLLFACQADPELHEQVRELLAEGPPVASDAVETIVARVRSSDAIARATQVALDHAAKARRALAPLPPSPAREVLAQLAEEVARRSS